MSTAGPTPTTVVPAVPQFEFSVLLPPGWREVETPVEPPDFTDPTAFLRLGVFVDDATTAVFSVGARPGYSQGTVVDWLAHGLREKGLAADEFKPFELASGTGVTALANDPASAKPTRLRAVAFEDGGNLLMLMATAPLEHWERLRPLLDQIVASFTLRYAQGPTVPLRRSDASPAPERPTKAYADFALADDDASLDPDQTINATIRDAGRGLVPRVLDVCADEKYATVGAVAISASFNVPFGWHILDDARRTLVFDAANQIQINFDLLDSAGATVDEIFNAILADLSQANPQAQYQRLDLDGMPAMVVKGQVIEGEHLEQAYVLKAIASRANIYLKARVTSSASDLPRAGDLLELLLRDMRFLP